MCELIYKEYLQFTLCLIDSSQRLHTLLSGLSPCILRVGGSSADCTYFDSPLEKLKQAGLQPVPEVISSEPFLSSSLHYGESDFRVVCEQMSE